MEEKFNVQLTLNEVILINKLFPGYIDTITATDFQLADYRDTALLVMLKFSQVLWLVNEQAAGNVDPTMPYASEVDKLRTLLQDVLNKVQAFVK